MNRARVNQYAKNQENRIMSIVERMGGKVIEYYGARKQYAGDILIEYDGKKIRIDHKSTRNETSHRIYKSWMPYLTNICASRTPIDGVSEPVVTLSFYNHNQIYALTAKQFNKEVLKWYEFAEGKNSRSVRRRDFEVYLNWPTKCITVVSHEEPEIQYYIHKFEVYLNEVIK